MEDENQDTYENNNRERKKIKTKRKELGLSCMLNTEVSALLAVIRRPPEPTSPYYFSSDDHFDSSSLLHSLKSLRALIFNPQQEWHNIDPSIYISPFLHVIQGDDVPAAATGVALYALLKILNLEIFDEKTKGAKEAINSIVTAISGCRLEKTDSSTEDAVMMRILQVLTAIMKHCASVLLTDHVVCNIVNTCFLVVQHSAGRGDLLQRNARYALHELIQIIFSRLPDLAIKDSESESESESESGSESETGTDDSSGGGAAADANLNSGYGIRSAVDIFRFLCSLLNVVRVVEMEGSTFHDPDEELQHFALVLINSAIELSGEEIGRHSKLLRMIQDDLFHHLIHYGTCSSPLVLSMICSTVLNIYHFLRRLGFCFKKTKKEDS